MKKLVLSLALLMNAGAFAVTDRDCNCNPSTTGCVFIEDCCENFKVCIDTNDVTCPGDTDGRIRVRVCPTTGRCTPCVNTPGQPPCQSVCVTPCIRVTLDGTEVKVSNNFGPVGGQIPGNAVVFAFEGLEAGEHTILVEQDCPRCVFPEQTVEIFEPEEIKVKCVETQCAHKGEEDGSATFRIIGGTPPFSFSVDGAPVFTLTPSNGQSRTFTIPELSCNGKHTVVVNDQASLTTPFTGVCDGDKCFSVDCCPKGKCDNEKKDHKRDHKKDVKPAVKKASAKKVAVAKKAVVAAAKKGAFIAPARKNK